MFFEGLCSWQAVPKSFGGYLWKSHHTVGVQQYFWAPHMSSISLPKRDFEESRSRNPTNIAMNSNPKTITLKYTCRNMVLAGSSHVRSANAQKHLSQNLQPLPWDASKFDLFLATSLFHCHHCKVCIPYFLLRLHSFFRFQASVCSVTWGNRAGFSWSETDFSRSGIHISFALLESRSYERFGLVHLSNVQSENTQLINIGALFLKQYIAI